MNGHKMRSLVVPAYSKYRSCQPLAFTDFLIGSFFVAEFSTSGEASVSFLGRGTIATGRKGGKRLHNTAGEQVPYTGQAFVLTVPQWALSAKGLAAADEFDRRGK